MKQIFLILLIWFCSISVFAKPQKYKALPCHGKRWNFSREAKPATLHKKFDKISRADLTQMLWHELSQHPKNDLALPMLQFLIETEKNRDFKSYYEVLGVVAYDTNTPVNTIYRNYPKKKTAIKNKKIKITEICQLYNKTVKNNL